MTLTWHCCVAERIAATVVPKLGKLSHHVFTIFNYKC